jgi:hypothetical protein
LYPPDVKERHERFLCVHRPATCRLQCGIAGLVVDTRPAHEENDCPNRIKKCKLGCGAEFVATEETYHEAPGEWSVCPMRLVRCRFGASSCRSVLPSRATCIVRSAATPACGSRATVTVSRDIRTCVC